MESNKALGRAGYLIAALLIIIPLYDASTSVWPPHISDERWRFGAVGALSNLTLVPLLGFFMVLAISALLDQRRVRRFVGIICAILAVILAALAALFVLDYFQTRTLVNPRMQHVMSVATWTAMGKHIVSIIALALLSRAGFAGPRVTATKKRVVVADTTPSPLIPVAGATRAE